MRQIKIAGLLWGSHIFPLTKTIRELPFFTAYLATFQELGAGDATQKFLSYLSGRNPHPGEGVKFPGKVSGREGLNYRL